VQIHPVLSDLLDSINHVTSLPADFEGKSKINNWYGVAADGLL